MALSQRCIAIASFLFGMLFLCSALKAGDELSPEQRSQMPDLAGKLHITSCTESADLSYGSCIKRGSRMPFDPLAISALLA